MTRGRARLLAPLVPGALLTLVALAVLAAPAPPAAPAADGHADDLIAFRLKNQYENLITDARYRGAPLVVSWADRNGSDHLDAWLPALRDTLVTELRGHRLRILDVADVAGVPFFIKGLVRSRMQESASGSVLLDWGGAFRKAYGCTPDHVNLILFDGESRLVAIYALAEYDSTLHAEVLTGIRGLL